MGRVNRRKIRGERGKWFTHVEGYKYPVPSLWDHQVTKCRDTNKFLLITDWSKNARPETHQKRLEMTNYFRQKEITSVVIARTKDVTIRPRENAAYVGVFACKVLSVEPEIKLEIVERIANAH
jgi:hypothetical protein